MLVYKIHHKTVEINEDVHLPRKGEIVWIHVTSEQKEKLEMLLNTLNIHPLAAQSMGVFKDIPKVDVYDNNAFVRVFGIQKNHEQVKVNMLVGNNYVITYSNKQYSLMEKLIEHFQDHPEYMEHPGKILYHCLHQLSNEYLEYVDLIADDIQELEKKVFKTPFANEIGRSIYRFKLKIHEHRQIVEAQETMMKSISHTDFPYIKEEIEIYLKDVMNNFSRITGAFDTFKENLTSIFDLQMSLKSDHMNAIMKILTMVSVVFLPMSFIAGLYGMNFEYMPELKWKYGYVYSLVLMFSIALSIICYFKVKGWWGGK
jgi:magnesium transporter